MKPHLKTATGISRLSLCSLAAFSLFASSSRAQQATAAPTVAQLARYDLNKNGRLDPDELAAQRADQTRAAGAVAAGTTAAAAAPAAGDTIQLSPFEVNEANTGYYASNTMSGTPPQHQA